MENFPPPHKKTGKDEDQISAFGDFLSFVVITVSPKQALMAFSDQKVQNLFEISDLLYLSS